MVRYRGEVKSLQAIDSGAPSTSFKYYVDVEREADYDLAMLNAAGEPLEHIVLKSKFTE